MFELLTEWETKYFFSFSNGKEASVAYVTNDAARQLGFEDGRECPRLSKLAVEYLKRTKGCGEDIWEFFASEPDAESLCDKLMDEFERCILSYFAFHWSQAPAMISQVNLVYTGPSKTRNPHESNISVSVDAFSSMFVNWGDVSVDGI